jgi:hypothetical protein
MHIRQKDAFKMSSPQINRPQPPEPKSNNMPAIQHQQTFSFSKLNKKGAKTSSAFSQSVQNFKKMPGLSSPMNFQHGKAKELRRDQDNDLLTSVKSINIL